MRGWFVRDILLISGSLIRLLEDESNIEAKINYSMCIAYENNIILNGSFASMISEHSVRMNEPGSIMLGYKQQRKKDEVGYQKFCAWGFSKVLAVYKVEF